MSRIIFTKIVFFHVHVSIRSFRNLCIYKSLKLSPILDGIILQHIAVTVKFRFFLLFHLKFMEKVFFHLNYIGKINHFVWLINSVQTDFGILPKIAIFKVFSHYSYIYSLQSNNKLGHVEILPNMWDNPNKTTQITDASRVRKIRNTWLIITQLSSRNSWIRNRPL